jgi:hypothetical protein
VRIGDKGVDKHGKQEAHVPAGADCLAKLTVLCEGPRGTIAKQLERTLGLTRDRTRRSTPPA